MAINRNTVPMMTPRESREAWCPPGPFPVKAIQAKIKGVCATHQRAKPATAQSMLNGLAEME
jgi:hypothetical protein